MDNEEIIKKYSNDEITVVWKPQKCQHLGECWRNLPEVFKPAERPWVKIENGTTEEIKKTIEKCGSGALSYYENK
ncbi:MAG: (4Fe-4S)-binding protein [Methanobrevibacter sp.]